MSRQSEPRYHKAVGRWYSRDGELNAKGESRQIYYPATVRTKAEAWAYQAKLREAKAARVINIGDPTFGGLSLLYHRWLENEVIEGRISPNTVKARKSCLRQFAFHRSRGREVGQILARDLRVDDLEGFVQAMVRDGYKGHYVKDVVRGVQACLNWAARPIPGREPRQILASNPLAGYRLAVATGETVGYVDSHDARAFLRWMWGRAREPRLDPTSGRWRAGAFASHLRFNRLFVLMLQFIRLTGCRPKEAAAALWSDVDWETGVIVLDPARHKTGRKTGRDRTIFFSGRAARVLRTIHDLPGRHPERIFTHRLGPGARDRGADPLAGEPWIDGGPISQKLRLLRSEAVAQGVAAAEGFTAYSLRHGWITDALLEGGTLPDVAKMSGNSAAVIERVYDHAVKDRLAERAKALANARRRSARGER